MQKQDSIQNSDKGKKKTKNPMRLAYDDDAYIKKEQNQQQQVHSLDKMKKKVKKDDQTVGQHNSLIKKETIHQKHEKDPLIKQQVKQQFIDQDYNTFFNFTNQQHQFPNVKSQMIAQNIQKQKWNFELPITLQKILQKILPQIYSQELNKQVLQQQLYKIDQQKQQDYTVTYSNGLSQEQEKQQNQYMGKKQFILSQSEVTSRKNNVELYPNSSRKEKTYYDIKQGIPYYFPFQKPIEAQENFMSAIFNGLKRSYQNLLVQSSTGTGKTLSLLEGTLAWAEKYYHQRVKYLKIANQKQQIDNRNKNKDLKEDPAQKISRQLKYLRKERQSKIKIIYTSRAHSQLGQIAKQLKKTPYRPKMLLFGAKEKLCINKLVKDKMKQRCDQQDFTTEQWQTQCNKALRYQKFYKKTPPQFNQCKIQNREIVLRMIKNSYYLKNLTRQQKQFYSKCIPILEKYLNITEQNDAHEQFRNFKISSTRLLRKIGSIITNKNKRIIPPEQLNALDFLYDLQMRCPYLYHWEEKREQTLFHQINSYNHRAILHNKKMKRISQRANPPLCPYYFPKRVKYFGTLYLMPYTYLFNRKILKYSAELFKDSIIIIDQGHNAPSAACKGFQTQLKNNIFESALKNIKKKDEKQTLKGKKQQIQQSLKQKYLKAQDKVANQMQQQNEFRLFQQNFKRLKLEENPQQQKKDYNKQEQNQKQEQQNEKKLSPEQKKRKKQLQKQLATIIGIMYKNFKNYFSVFKSSWKKTNRDDDSDNQQSPNINPHYFKKIRKGYQKTQVSMKQQLHKILFSKQLTNQLKQQIETQIKKSVVCHVQYSAIEQVIKRQISSNSQLLIPIQYKIILQKINQLISIKFSIKQYYFQIQSLSSCLKLLHDVSYYKKYNYRFILELIQSKRERYGGQTEYNGQIQLKCVAPQLGFRQLMKIKPRSLIIASGTLEPIDFFKRQIGIQTLPFVSAGTVVKQKNIFSANFHTDLKGHTIQFKDYFGSGDYKIDKKNIEKINNNIERLLELLIRIIKCIPHGVLVVVTSFTALDKIEQFYKENEAIRQKLDYQKEIFFERRRNIQKSIQDFKIKAVQPHGALMFCVHRAKLTEGMDFKDKLCRGVIFFGIPFLNYFDQINKQKTTYLQKIKSKYQKNWEYIEAAKVINQAIGRTVRHEKDYGSIIFIDNRFSYETSLKYTSNVAKVRKHVSSLIIGKILQVNNTNIQHFESQINKFYQESEQHFQNRQQNQNNDNNDGNDDDNNNMPDNDDDNFNDGYDSSDDDDTDYKKSLRMKQQAKKSYQSYRNHYYENIEQEQNNTSLATANNNLATTSNRNKRINSNNTISNINKTTNTTIKRNTTNNININNNIYDFDRLNNNEPILIWQKRNNSLNKQKKQKISVETKQIMKQQSMESMLAHINQYKYQNQNQNQNQYQKEYKRRQNSSKSKYTNIRPKYNIYDQYILKQINQISDQSILGPKSLFENHNKKDSKIQQFKNRPQIKKELKKMQQQGLDKLFYKVSQNAKCLYQSLSYFIMKRQCCHYRKIKAILYQQIKRNVSLYAGKIRQISRLQPKQYLKKMIEQNHYGTLIQLYAASNIFNLTFKIISLKKPNLTISWNVSSEKFLQLGRYHIDDNISYYFPNKNGFESFNQSIESHASKQKRSISSQVPENMLMGNRPTKKQQININPNIKIQLQYDINLPKTLDQIKIVNDIGILGTRYNYYIKKDWRIEHFISRPKDQMHKDFVQKMNSLILKPHFVGEHSYCMYEALAVFFFYPYLGPAQFSRKIKAILYKQIQSNLQQYSCDIAKWTKYKINQYTKEMIKQSHYGNEVQLYAASKVFNCKFRIISYKSPSFFISWKTNKNPKIFTLGRYKMEDHVKYFFPALQCFQGSLKYK